MCPSSLNSPHPMPSTPLLRCLFCGHVNPGSAIFCMDCGTQLDLQPCNKCDAVDSRTSTNCHKCGAPFASIWAPIPAPEAPNASPETVHEHNVASVRPRRGWLVLVASAILVSVVVAGYTYIREPEQLAPRLAAPHVVVAMPSQPSSSAVPAQMDAMAKSTSLPLKLDIGNVDHEKDSSKAAPSAAPTPEAAANTTTVRSSSTANANVRSRPVRPVLKECSPAVATLGLCDPEPQQENR